MGEFIRGCPPIADSRVACTHRMIPPQEIVERGGHPYCMHARWHQSGWFCRHFAEPDPYLVCIGKDVFLSLVFEDTAGSIHVRIVGFRIAGGDDRKKLVPLHFRAMVTPALGQQFILRLSADDALQLAELVGHGALNFMLDSPELDPAAKEAVAQRLREMISAIKVIERGW